jgi:NitT/TauT family transport system substrate-binding protein
MTGPALLGSWRRLAGGLGLALVLVATACAGPAAPTSTANRSEGARTSPPSADAAAPTGGAATPPLAPVAVRVMHNAVAGSQALLQVIQDAGLFTQHGLAVEISNATPRATTAALLAGEVPLMVSSGIHPVSAGLAGGDTVIISGGISTLDSSLWTSEVLEPEGLRGRRIGVSTFGDAADFAARFAAKRWGLDPTRDLEILQTGQPAERLAALQAGAVDATIIQPPLTVVARKAGLHQLAEMADLGLEYQHTGVVTTRARLAADADVLERFVGAWAEGVYYYRAQPEAARAAVGRFMNLEDPDALAETYERYIKWYARPPYPTLSGIQSILDQLAEGEDPRARTAWPEEFVDNRFLDKLSAAGQFQRWDQQYPAAQ